MRYRLKGKKERKNKKKKKGRTGKEKLNKCKRRKDRKESKILDHLDIPLDSRTIDGEAPNSSKVKHVSACSRSAAQYSAVLSFSVVALTSAPPSTNARTVAVCPLLVT